MNSKDRSKAVSQDSRIEHLRESPKIHGSVFVADGARIIGDVVIGEQSSVWYNTVIRGDVNSIKIGRRTNIQDGCVLHVTGGTAPLVIGDRITVGHMAVLHGCTVEDLCLIGMGAIVLDCAVIGRESLIGAGALVTSGTKIPSRSLVIGSPGRVVRPLTSDEIAQLAESADHYVELAAQYMARSPTDS